MDSIIIRPIITEKSMKEANLGHFTFAVRRDARKPEIKKEVEKNFNVKVEGIETIIVKGRKKRVGPKRRMTKVAPWKKAVVKLISGQKIDLFAGGENEPKT